MPTWTDTQLDRWMKDAERDIVSRMPFRFHSFSLAITSGTGTYTFNERLVQPVSVLWKGETLSPFIGTEIHAISPTFRDVQGKPTAYQMSNDGISTIRLLPVPSESLAILTGDLHDSTVVETGFVIRGYVFPDNTVDYFQLPDYLFRNIVKAYVLSRAFHAEGIGQNLKAAEYWQSRYFMFLDQFNAVSASFHSSKERLDIEEICQKKRRHLGELTSAISKPIFHIPAFSGRDTLNNWLDAVVTDLQVDPSVLQVSAGDDLNNWLDAIVTDVGNVLLSVSASDDLNNWNDSIASAQTGFFSLSASDDLNNWLDAASVSNDAAVPAPSSLWLLDEGSGTTASDSVGSIDGTLEGNAAFDTEGCNFDGNDNIDCGDNYDQDGTGALSMSAVVRSSNTGAQQDIMGKGRGSAPFNGFAMYMISDQIRFFMINTFSTNKYFEARTGVVVSDNDWFHVTVTYDGSGVVAGVKIYIDGVSQTVVSVQDTLAGNSTSSTGFNFTLGNRQDLWSLGLNGDLGMARFWDGVELTASEVSTWYTTDQGIMSGRSVTI